MNKLINKNMWLACLLGILPLAVPLTVGAESDLGARDDLETRSDVAPRSDDEVWQQGQAQLQKQLQPGQSANTYRKKIEEMGYLVTSVNYDDEDYLEYEIVKGDQTYEVQINIDEDTGKATAVDVAMNVWKTDATEQALAQAQTPAGTATTTAARRGNQYSDRDRSRADQLVKELEALPTGQDKGYYKDELKKRGYQITKVNTDEQDQLELEAVKNGQSLELDVSFDDDTGRSTAVDADTLWMESEATTREREKQERTPTKSGTGTMGQTRDDRTSGM